MPIIKRKGKKRVTTKRVQTKYMDIDGHMLPVRYYQELGRRSIRMTFGKDAILFRVPLESMISEKTEKEYWDWFMENAIKHIRKDPSIINMYISKSYQDGQEYPIEGKTYILHIKEQKRKTLEASVSGSNIAITIPSGMSDEVRNKSIKSILSRIISRDRKDEVIRRIQELNFLHFKIPDINKVALKYTTSNWGSCSTNGNINLSSRLLFAPQDVLDYVIIHELAHFFERNHSARFWKVVRDAMPDYKMQEKWLKENGHLCDF